VCLSALRSAEVDMRLQNKRLQDVIASLPGLRLHQYFMKHQQKSVNDHNNMRRLLVEGVVFISGLQRIGYSSASGSPVDIQAVAVLVPKF